MKIHIYWLTCVQYMYTHVHTPILIQDDVVIIDSCRPSVSVSLSSHEPKVKRYSMFERGGRRLRFVSLRVSPTLRTHWRLLKTWMDLVWMCMDHMSHCVELNFTHFMGEVGSCSDMSCCPPSGCEQSPTFETPISCGAALFRKGEGVFAHACKKRSETERRGATGGCLMWQALCPVGHILFWKILSGNTRRPARKWHTVFTCPPYHMEDFSVL